MSDVFAPGGAYDTSLVTYADRLKCYREGHNVNGYGTIVGWCTRCKHSVWTYDRKSVMTYGTFVEFPPAHAATSLFGPSEPDPPAPQKFASRFWVKLRAIPPVSR